MQCALCKSEECLEDSHIVPAFVFRYLKKISITGYLRDGDQPNKRSMDGPKPRLLGPLCEDLFSIWEGRFASDVFYPLHEGDLSTRTLVYGDWLSKFAVSISWRALCHSRDKHQGRDLPHGHTPLIQPTLDVWREYLQGLRDNIGCHIQHMVFLGGEISLPGTLDPHDLAFYLERAIDYSTVHSPSDAYIITKLGRVLIVGTIFTQKPSDWQGTQIDLDGGRYGPGDFQTAGCVFTFFQHAINDLAASRLLISPKQRQRIEEALHRRHGSAPT